MPTVRPSYLHEKDIRPELPLYPAAKAASERLLAFLEASPTAWQAVETASRELESRGFKKYDLLSLPQLKEGAKGYFVQNGSALLAFRVGKGGLKKGFRIFGSHTDSPCLKIKPKAISCKEGVWRLNTEVYGGPLLNSFFDRPLSLAGRVFLKGKTAFSPECRLIDFKKPLLILPNVAIHMNREANEGVKIERQNVLFPFLFCSDETPSEDLLTQLIAEELGVSAKKIMDFELMTYEAASPSFCGLNDCFISSGRLDNLSMLYAGLRGLLDAEEPGEGVQIVLSTDNEEVGSRTKQGADSFLTRDLLEGLAIALGADRKAFLAAFEHSFMISADLAHAVHPNYAAYADPDHRPKINAGPVIKVAASQAYATDARSASIFRALAEKAGVPIQLFVNRSDLRGGSTIGPLSSSLLPMPAVDVGNPIWGMHSIRETGGVLDQWYMEKIAACFFSES